MIVEEKWIDLFRNIRANLNKSYKRQLPIQNKFDNFRFQITLGLNALNIELNQTEFLSFSFDEVPKYFLCFIYAE